MYHCAFCHSEISEVLIAQGYRYCPHCSTKIPDNITGATYDYLAGSVMAASASNATAVTAYGDLQRRGTLEPDLSYLRTQIYGMHELSHQMEQSFMEYAMHENEKDAKEKAEQDARRYRSQQIIYYLRVDQVRFKQITSFNGDLFKEDIPKLFELMSFECKNQPDFHNGVDLLAKVFDVPLCPLQELVNNPVPCWKSVNLIHAWLKQNGAKNYQDIIDIWTNILKLRQSESHDFIEEDILEAYKFFGIDDEIDYSRLWEKVLDTFLQSLKDLNNILQSMPIS